MQQVVLILINPMPRRLLPLGPVKQELLTLLYLQKRKAWRRGSTRVVSGYWLHLPYPHPQYDFVELLDGSRLIAREQRNLVESERAGRQARSISLHEAGFIQYLDSGIWHLAFYNDGKNPEPVSFNTIVIGKSLLQSILFHRLPKLRDE